MYERVRGRQGRRRGDWARKLLWGLSLASVLFAHPRGIGAEGDAAPAPAPQARRVVEPDGAAAPDGCWLTDGGSWSRSRRTQTRVPSAPLEVAWSHTMPKGTVVVGDPRVWRERLVFECLQPDGSRTLNIHAVNDGRPLHNPISFPHGPTLDPSVWADTILVRAGSQRLEAWQERRGKMAATWSYETSAPIEDALLVRHDVFARTAGAVLHLRMGLKKPLWEATAESVLEAPFHPLTPRSRRFEQPKWTRFAGRLAYFDGRLFTTVLDNLGNESVCIAEVRGSGPPQLAEAAFVGVRSDRNAKSPTLLVPTAGGVLLRYGSPVKTKTDGTATDAVCCYVDGIAVLHAPALFDALTPPAADVLMWHWMVGSPTEQPTLGWGLFEKDRPQTWHRLPVPGVSYPVHAPVIAADVLLLGANAHVIASNTPLWTCREQVTATAIPATERLLLMPSTSEIVALGTAAKPVPLFAGQWAPREGEPLGAVRSAAGILLERGGEVYEGAWEVDPATPDELQLKPAKGKGKRMAAANIDLALDEQHHLLFARDVERLQEHYPRPFDAVARNAYIALADRARKMRNGAAMELAIGTAELLGWMGPDALAAWTRATKEREKPPLFDAPRSETDKWYADFRAVGARSDQHAFATAEALLADARWDVQKRGVAWLVELGATNHKGIRALLRREVPEFMPIPEKFAPMEWLGVAEALRGMQAERVPPPERESADLTREQRMLGSARHTWRADLQGFRAGPLFILTPLDEPAQLATCLEQGLLALRALEELFAEGQHPRIDPFPLCMHLCESKEAFAKLLAQGGRDPTLADEIAGFYDSKEGLMHAFLPTGGDSFENVRGTYVHELVHQYIDERCPLFPHREHRRPSDMYWIVEGMAELVQSFKFDLKNKTWETLDSNASPLVLLAGAPANRILPWGGFFHMNGAQRWRMSSKDDIKIPDPQDPHRYWPVSNVDLFYAQAGATCIWLYHQGGRLRQAMLDTVRDAYTERPPLDSAGFVKRFGMSESELGERVHAFARETARDKRFPPLRARAAAGR